MTMTRGRPAGRMTPLRKKALALMAEEARAGGFISYAKVARKLGLTDYRNARRVVNDLRKLGLVEAI